MNHKNLYQDLLAEARAIHIAIRGGAITYDEAKRKTKPLLDIVNARIKQIAVKYGQKPKLLVLQDLGRTL